MADLARGKIIFEQRIEYPLPRVQGVRDYVFFFVPDSDGYGQGARSFLSRFYPRHTSRDVSSLEALVDVLNSDVTSGGVSRIREVVIVSHGSPEGLLLRVLRDASSENLPEYQHLTPFSLSFLQHDFAGGRFASFRQRRQRVVEAMREGAWVTVRACRFGGGADPLYALYSFFGGRANVYAPVEYQFFGTLPIKPGMRLENLLEAHDHLVRQRLKPQDRHTPERQDAIVATLVDPGRFSQPFELASAPFDQPDGDEGVRYRRLVDALNAGRLNDAVRERFTANGRTLSPDARLRVVVLVRDVAWSVYDRVTHAGQTFTVEYDVGEEIIDTPGGRRTSLRAAARVMDAFSAYAKFPLQMFMFESNNNEFRGMLGVLASYLDEGGVPEGRPRFDALFATLPQTNTAIPVPAPLRTGFADVLGLELPATATVRLSDRKGRAPLERLTWTVEHGERHLVKLEHPVTSQGVRGHSLSVFVDLANPQRQTELLKLTGHSGLDPDAPGTELAAYLDRFTIDDLVALIDFLRSPYRSENWFYIHHAQLAIRRKKEYPAWTKTQHDDNDPLGTTFGPYEMLSGAEAEDQRRFGYEFDFNAHWHEVLVSHHRIGPFQTDLFAEEDLFTKLDLPGDIADRDREVTIEADSPFVDIEAIRQLERQGREEFFAVEKAPRFEAARDPGLSCAEFTAVVHQWKQLQGQPPEEIRRLLGLQVASDGKTFLDHVKALWDVYQLYDIGDTLLDIAKVEDGLAVKLVDRIPRYAPRLLGPSIVASVILRVWTVLSIPLDLWNRTAEAEEAADQVAENIGRFTAIRQWLRVLIGRAGTENLPDDFEIDLSMLGEAHPFIARYVLEQIQNFDMSIFRFIYDPDRARAGFDEGVRVMRKVSKEIVERADEAVAEILRQPGMDACKVKVLQEAGIIDLDELRGRIIMQIAAGLLKLVPEV